MTNKEAWEYAFGMIQVDKLIPSPELIDFSNQEIAGKITMEDIICKLDEKYGKKKAI